MAECVILFRYPNGRVDFIHAGEGDPPKMAIYPDTDTALLAARDIPVCQVAPFQIVELDF